MEKVAARDCVRPLRTVCGQRRGPVDAAVHTKGGRATVVIETTDLGGSSKGAPSRDLSSGGRAAVSLKVFTESFLSKRRGSCLICRRAPIACCQAALLGSLLLPRECVRPHERPVHSSCRSFVSPLGPLFFSPLLARPQQTQSKQPQTEWRAQKSGQSLLAASSWLDSGRQTDSLSFSLAAN